MNTLQLLATLELGLIYGLVAIGIYLTFRVIDFADLTVDGSFTLGGAVSAVLIIHGYSPVLSLFVATLAGGVAGAVTGILHIKWKIFNLLAGILVMTALYSINLRIMAQPNLSITTHTIFAYGNVIVVITSLVVAIICGLAWFMATNFGLGLRASGINNPLSLAYGINVNIMKVITLGLSNGIVALSGALFAQSQGFIDISIGTGTIVVGIASVIIGESIMRPKNIAAALAAVVVGSILYRLAISLALNATDLGLHASDLNLITALLVVVVMAFSKTNKRVGS
jgi:putative ABC transport system permease protein